MRHWRFHSGTQASALLKKKNHVDPEFRSIFFFLFLITWWPIFTWYTHKAKILVCQLLCAWTHFACFTLPSSRWQHPSKSRPLQKHGARKPRLCSLCRRSTISLQLIRSWWKRSTKLVLLTWSRQTEKRFVCVQYFLIRKFFFCCFF